MIEYLFKITAKKETTEDEMRIFQENIENNITLVNEVSQDVFTYGEDVTLIETAIENNNEKIIEFLLKYIDIINIKNFSNLLLSLSMYCGDLTTFIKISDTFVWDKLEDIKEEINPISQYTKLEEFINLVIYNNNNPYIIKFVLNKYHERSFINFKQHNFNYDIVSQFYIDSNKYKNIIYFMDNSVDFYINQHIQGGINSEQLKNIERTISQKVKEYNFIVKNEQNYQDIFKAYQRVYFNKLNFLTTDILQLCCFSPELFYKNKVLFKDFNNTFILTFIESLFKKHNFSKCFSLDNIQKIARFLNDQVKGNFLIGGEDDFSKTQGNVIESILSFHNDPAYIPFFRNFNLFLNSRQSNCIVQLLSREIKCSIQHLIELVSIHKIKKLDSNDHNLFLFNIINGCEKEKNINFSSLTPLLKLIKPDFSLINSYNYSNMHFFVTLSKSPYYQNLIDFYRPETEHILSTLIFTDRKNSDFCMKTTIINLLEYIKKYELNTDIVKDTRALINSYPLSRYLKLNEEESELYISEIEAYKINYEMLNKLNIHENNDNNIKIRKRL